MDNNCLQTASLADHLGRSFTGIDETRWVLETSVQLQRLYEAEWKLRGYHRSP